MVDWIIFLKVDKQKKNPLILSWILYLIFMNNYFLLHAKNLFFWVWL